MSVIEMQKLLEAGVHFGHQTRRWDPKMKKYIFAERNGIHIIDLQKTVKLIDVAFEYMKKIADDGGIALFVGTKKQAQDAIHDEAVRAKQFFINHRWLGGTLTNWDTIQKRIKRLKEIKQMEEDGTFEVLPKKEVALLIKQQEKLQKFLGGIEEMPRIPDVLFIVDPKREHIAVREARKLKIPIVAMVDTNSDPDEIDVVIPSNDDAIRAIKIITAKMADAFVQINQGEEGSVEEAMMADINSSDTKTEVKDSMANISDDESDEGVASHEALEELVEVVEGDNKNIKEKAAAKKAATKKTKKVVKAEEVKETEKGESEE